MPADDSDSPAAVTPGPAAPGPMVGPGAVGVTAGVRLGGDADEVGALEPLAGAVPVGAATSNVVALVGAAVMGEGRLATPIPPPVTPPSPGPVAGPDGVASGR